VKKNKLLLLLLSVFIMMAFTPKDFGGRVQNKWTGFVSFFEKKTGPDIVISEWKMDATINDDVCNVIHSFIFENLRGDTIKCRSEEETELEVGFDEEKRKYYIAVRVPGCSGISDETEIIVNDQPIPNDRKLLAGQIVLRDGPDSNGDASRTTYSWHLEMDKKKKP